MKNFLKKISFVILLFLSSFMIVQAAINIVPNGGTGVGTITGLIKGNGTSAFTAAVSGTDYLAPGSAVTSVSGTANRITSSGGATPVINISGSYVGQSSITTVGTLTSGAIGSGFTAIDNASLANSTISGIALGSNLNALTATNTTLTFSGSYNGSTARTVGLNLGNTNTWTGQQTFSVAAPILGTITGSDQCLHVNTSGLISGTGSDCGSGGGGLTVGTTSIASGTTSRVLYDNAGTLGEYTVSGSGNVAMTTSPVFTTPNIGVATGSVSGNAGTATILATARNIWGQSFDGSAPITGSLTGVGDITGGASNMAITAGTGNSRTLTLKSTTGGGTATAFLTGNADQSTTFGGNILGTGALTITGGAGNMTLVSGTGASRTMTFQTTTAGSSATTALTLAADQSATFANTVNATTFVGALTGNASTASSAAILTTTRGIYGNNFDGSAALTQIIASTYGGTGNGFTKFSGPGSTEKTFTLPNASAAILTDNAAVTVAQGGTGLGTLTANNVILGNGTSNPTFVAPGTSGDVLTSNGSTWTSAAAGGGSFAQLATASLGSPAATLASGTFTAKKHLRVVIWAPTFGTTDQLAVQFNGDTAASQYSVRTNFDAVSQGTSTSNRANFQQNNLTAARYLVIDIINIAAYNKNLHYYMNATSDTYDGGGFWNNATDQITSITVLLGGGNNLPTGTEITVWGMD